MKTTHKKGEKKGSKNEDTMREEPAKKSRGDETKEEKHQQKLHFF